MTEAARRLASPGSWDLPRLTDAIANAVWWVTLVDATLVRYHPRNYESTLAGRSARRRETGYTWQIEACAAWPTGVSQDPVGTVRQQIPSRSPRRSHHRRTLAGGAQFSLSPPPPEAPRQGCQPRL